MLLRLIFAGVVSWVLVAEVALLAAIGLGLV